MKIFAVSDIHMDFRFLDKVAPDTELILIAGDFCNWGDAEEVESSLEKLKRIQAGK